MIELCLLLIWRSGAGVSEEDELFELGVVESNCVYSLVEDRLVPHEQAWASIPHISLLCSTEVSMIFLLSWKLQEGTLGALMTCCILLFPGAGVWFRQWGISVAWSGCFTSKEGRCSAADSASVGRGVRLQQLSRQPAGPYSVQPQYSPVGPLCSHSTHENAHNKGICCVIFLSSKKRCGQTDALYLHYFIQWNDKGLG